MKRVTGREFAERLRKLRKDRKISQSSLGGLVDRSDKAVSKWENEGIIPSMEVLLRIASALNVGIEDLIGEVEPDVPRESWNLLMHRKALWNKAEKRLHELYGSILPLPVLNRFGKEKSRLAGMDAIIHFDIIRELSLEAQKQGKYFETDGSCSSFAAWLMGANPINPLPAHYRCPGCKRTEFHPETLSGWDLPEKRCECGQMMERDGQDLPFEVGVCGSSDPYSTHELNVGLSFMEEAQKIILPMAGPYFSLKRYEDQDDGTPLLPPPEEPDAEVVYLPYVCIFLEAKKDDKTPDYIEDIERVEEEFNWSISTSYAAFTLMPVLEPKRTGRKPKQRTPELKDLLQEEVLARALAKYSKEVAATNYNMQFDFTLRDPEKYRKGITFGKYISLLCTMETGFITDGSPESIAEGLGLKDPAEYPVSQVDLWKLIMSCADNPADITGIAEMLLIKCRNREYLQGIPDEDRELFNQLHLPPWFSEYAKQLFALASRSIMTVRGYKLLKEVWVRMQVER